MDWIEYDWPLEGRPAKIAADISHTIPAPGHETLLFVDIAPGQAGSPFSPQEQRKIPKLEKKLNGALKDALYVGAVRMDALIRLYYYVEDGISALEAAQAVCDNERLLLGSARTAFEPDWLTYRELLRPNAEKYQTVLNGELILKQIKQNDAIEKPRRLTLIFAFATEQHRLAFVPAAKQAGFALGDPDYFPEMALPHGQTLYVISTLEKHEVDAITTRAIIAARPFGGELLRWLCPKISKKSPLA